jgi:ferredoxin
MPASIYYFTGTGNSLHVARAVAEQLGESKVMNIVRQNGLDVIEDKSDTVGIIFPVYYYNMPHIVQEFVKKLQLDSKAYVFGIATCGGKSGNSIQMLDRLLKVNGVHLSAGFTLTMVDNAYIGIIDLVTPPEERGLVLKASEDSLSDIIEILKKKEKHELKSDYSLVTGLTGDLGIALTTHIYRLSRRFKATDKCTGCGICEKLCPAGNITCVDKKVTWGNNCTQCLACFNWCPQTAIEIGNRSANIARYHHPDIALKDMLK